MDGAWLVVGHVLLLVVRGTVVSHRVCPVAARVRTTVGLVVRLALLAQEEGFIVFLWVEVAMVCEKVHLEVVITREFRLASGYGTEKGAHGLAEHLA